MSAPRPDRFTPLELGAWHGFLRTHAQLVRRLDALLVASHNLPLTHFDVLVQLSLAGGSLRMSELAEALLLSRSGVTRIVDVLETTGLVSRSRDPEDARGTLAMLTPEGSEALGSAASAHIENVRRLFLAPLDDERRRSLARAWDAIDAALPNAEAPDRPRRSSRAPARRPRRGARPG